MMEFSLQRKVQGQLDAPRPNISFIRRELGLLSVKGRSALSSLEDKISKLKEAIDALKERAARVEGIVEQMDKRLNHIETELRELRRELNARFYWLMGILITMWVTIILTIMLK
jgi:chromosome segregation ATPase